MQGGGGSDSGRITSSGDMGFVTILGNLIGGANSNSGNVRSGAKLTGVKIGGSRTGRGRPTQR